MKQEEDLVGLAGSLVVTLVVMLGLPVLILSILDKVGQRLHAAPGDARRTDWTELAVVLGGVIILVTIRLCLERHGGEQAGNDFIGAVKLVSLLGLGAYALLVFRPCKNLKRTNPRQRRKEENK